MASTQTDPQKETIDGVLFEVTPLTWKRARRLFVRLVKALGPALGALLEGAPSLAALQAEAATQGGLAEVLGKACAGLADDDLEATFSDLAEVTRYSEDGGAHMPFLTPAAQELLFRGRMLLSFKFLAFALRVQFSDFFAALARPPAGHDPKGGTRASSPA